MAFSDILKQKIKWSSQVFNQFRSYMSNSYPLYPVKNYVVVVGLKTPFKTMNSISKIKTVYPMAHKWIWTSESEYGPVRESEHGSQQP